MSLSVALSIPFRALLDEDDQTIATYMQQLDDAHEEAENRAG